MSHLRQRLDQAADPCDGEVDLARLHQRVEVRRRHAGQRRSAAVALVVVALLATTAALARPSPGEQLTATDEVQGADDESDPPATSDATSSTAVPSTDDTATSTESTTTTSSPPSTTASAPPPPTVAPPPTTTTPAPTTTSEPSAPVPTAPPSTRPTPSPGQIALEGTYAGVEIYRLGAPPCPDITHVHDASVRLDDGRDWALHEDYCGTHHGSQWSGAGTFTLGDPNGARLTGTFTSTAPGGSSGVPYSLDVTDGTGSLRGAHGRCDLTVHIEVEAFGRQRHRGSITCRVSLSGGEPSGSGSQDPRP